MSWGSSSPDNRRVYASDLLRRPMPYRDYLPGIKMFHWMGWRAYPDDLYHYGWKIAQTMMPNPRDCGERCEIALHHPAMGATGCSSVSYDRTLHMSDLAAYHGGSFREEWGSPIHFPIKMELGRDILVPQSMIDAPWMEIEPHEYDRPRRINPERLRGLRGIPIFQQARQQQRQSNDPRIILEQATLSEVLEFALEKQKPVQDELRRQRVVRSRLAAELHLMSAA